MPRTERGKRAKDTYLQKSASKCNTLTSYISYKYLLVVMLISNALGPFSRRNSNRIHCRVKQKMALVPHVLET